MKLLRTLILFDTGSLLNTDDWRNLYGSYAAAIRLIEHPVGSGSLTLRRKIQLPNKQWTRNGVNFLKARFLASLTTGSIGNWKAEGPVKLARDRDQPAIVLYPSLEPYREPITSDFGKFDFMATGEHGTRFAVEWETGNISSSHRSMNKLAIGLSNGVIDVGILILPSRSLYQHLTDRVGNIGELSGYLAMWEALKVTVPRGLLAISVVEHDALTDDESLPYLTVGVDGRAKQGKAKL